MEKFLDNFESESDFTGNKMVIAYIHGPWFNQKNTLEEKKKKWDLTFSLNGLDKASIVNIYGQTLK